MARRSNCEQLAPLSLRAGDEILVLNDDSRADFSARLLTVVDSGPLASAAAARQTWFEVLKAVHATTRVSARTVAEAMTRQGQLRRTL